MARTKSAPASGQSTATIGFEAKLWLTADKLRNNMDAAEYKHVVLGLIFLKYIVASRMFVIGHVASFTLLEMGGSRQCASVYVAAGNSSHCPRRTYRTA